MIRIPVLAVFIALCLGAAYLGFATVQLEHDKAVHFVTFLALGLCFYWVLDIPRRRAVQFTLLAVGLVAGVASEFIQPMVNPQRQYDPLDIVANLAGVCVSTVVNSWYHKRMLERRRQARYRMLRGDASEEMPAVDIEMGLREPQELSEQDAITQPQGDRQESSGK